MLKIIIGSLFTKNKKHAAASKIQGADGGNVYDAYLVYGEVYT